jgi:hypothetical protein
MLIPKSNVDDGIFPSWVPLVDSKHKPLRPVIRCKCGQFCGIINHHIHSDGRVTASFLHGPPMTNNPCGFHEFLELADWDGRDLPPGVEA